MEKYFLSNQIQNDTTVTPVMIYYSFMTSNEYRLLLKMKRRNSSKELRWQLRVRLPRLTFFRQEDCLLHQESAK